MMNAAKQLDIEAVATARDLLADYKASLSTQPYESVVRIIAIIDETRASLEKMETALDVQPRQFVADRHPAFA